MEWCLIFFWPQSTGSQLTLNLLSNTSVCLFCKSCHIFCLWCVTLFSVTAWMPNPPGNSEAQKLQEPQQLLSLLSVFSLLLVCQDVIGYKLWVYTSTCGRPSININKHVATNINICSIYINNHQHLIIY